MTLTDFYELLERTDWTYEMSDDSRVAAHGRQKMAEVRRLANLSNEHKVLFDAFHKYVWQGGEKPSRPFVSGLTDVKPGE